MTKISFNQVLAEKAISLGAFQKVSELKGFITILKKRKLRRILEIGSWRGGTFYAWCQIAQPAATLVALDLSGGSFGGGVRSNNLAAIRCYPREKQRAYYVNFDSHLATTQATILKLINGKLDFLFIDGDHTYEGVKKDWEMYEPMVRKGGIIAFHDIVVHSKSVNCQVFRFWREIKLLYRHLEIVDLEEDEFRGIWGGIGVIYKDPS